MEEEPGTAPSLRQSNRLRVIQALQVLGVTSRADVARYTRLSRSTVSTIVAELQAEGIVVDRDPDGRPTAGGGRPPALIALDPSAGLALGVDFGKRHLAVAVADLSHEILAEEWREMPDDYDATHRAWSARPSWSSWCWAPRARTAGECSGVGMGLPGPMHRSGAVGSSAILPGWAGTHAAERMSERLGMPVWLRNDANLGALAEATWGAGRRRLHVVYLKLATGIGAGIVIDGRLFHGAGGTAGEIGHTSLDETGDICRCGNRGCLETYASAAGDRGPAEPQPRRATRARDDVIAAGRRRRSRLPARNRRRRPPHRRRRGEPVQPLQPRADRRGGQHGRRRRRAARAAARGSADYGPFRARRRTWRSSPASSASAPSCSARWRSCSTRQVPHGAGRPRRSSRQRQHGKGGAGMLKLRTVGVIFALVACNGTRGVR